MVLDREKYLVYQREYAREHSEKRKENFKLWYQKNKEKRNQQTKKNYVKNKKKILAKQKDYYLKNKDTVLIKHKDYRSKNREKIKKYIKEYYKLNPEIKKKQYLKYREKNLEKILKYQKEWYKLNKKSKLDYSKIYHSKNIEKRSKYAKEYRNENREKRKEYISIKKKIDPAFRLALYIRGRFRLFLRSNNISKNNPTFELVGCGPKELKLHIEKQFLPGMSWDNYGRNTWHIDHIIPLAKARTYEDVVQLRLMHYTNFQPLWAKDNMRKSDLIEGVSQGKNKYIKVL